MPLDVLIVTPSKPFGELIRLTLEADPAFRCLLIDRGEELRAAIQTSNFQTVIFDCSCSQPAPDEVLQMVRRDYPSLSLLFIPSESNLNQTQILPNQADGTISRPFDASILVETLYKSIQKRKAELDAIELSNTTINPQSWLNGLQGSIHTTSASSGLIIIDSKVAEVTSEISNSLQEQVVAAVLQYWNPSDTSDLMRYIKEPVTNQEWMMYATQISDSGVLVLIYQPQTPVTKVRIQTIQVARQLAANQAKGMPVLQPDEEMPEFQDPPVLKEILAEANNETHRRDPTSFPVEWFKEIDLPVGSGNIRQEDLLPKSTFSDSQIENQNEMEDIFLSEQHIVPEVDGDEEDTGISSEIPEFETNQPMEESYLTLEQSEIEREVASLEFLGTQNNLGDSSINLPETPSENLDLGSFQPVDLIAETSSVANLDSLQQVTLSTDTSPMILEGKTFHRESEELETANPSENCYVINSPSPELPLNNMPVDIIVQSADGNLHDYESYKPEIINESEIPFSGKLDLTKGIPGDFSETTELENLPFFLSTSLNKTPVDQSSSNTTGDMEAVLTYSSNSDLPPDGEPSMENFSSDKEYIIDQSVQSIDETTNQKEIKSSTDFKEGDLFTRMHRLQSAEKNEGTATITVALIPQQDQILLQREIAGILNQSMGRLSQAFGWKLENLTIRPTYMQWTMTIPNLFSAEDMIGIIRLQTTQYLFENFPGLQLLTKGNDIWAPESMMATDNNFVPSIHWQNFIFRRKNNEIA